MFSTSTHSFCSLCGPCFYSVFYMSDSRMRAHCYSGSPSRPFSTTAQNVPAGRAALLWQLRTIFQHAQSSIECPGFPHQTVRGPLQYPNMNRSRRTQLHVRRCHAQCRGEPHTCKLRGVRAIKQHCGSALLLIDAVGIHNSKEFF